MDADTSSSTIFVWVSPMVVLDSSWASPRMQAILMCRPPFRPSFALRASERFRSRSRLASIAIHPRTNSNDVLMTLNTKSIASLSITWNTKSIAPPVAGGPCMSDALHEYVRSEESGRSTTLAAPSECTAGEGGAGPSALERADVDGRHTVDAGVGRVPGHGPDGLRREGGLVRGPHQRTWIGRRVVAMRRGHPHQLGRAGSVGAGVAGRGGEGGARRG